MPGTLVRIVLAVALVLVVGSPAAGSSALRSTAAGKIAFSSNRTGTWNVYVANADGSAVRQLTTAGGDYPVWSPDGTKLAYLWNGTTYVADADGSNAHAVTRGVDQAWSPDGTKLAFMRAWSIYVANADGSGERQLTHADTGDIRTLAALPSWSPDGTRIAFTTLNGFFVIGADGSGQTQLSTSGSDPDSWARARWSPDGSSIAFVPSTCCAQGDIHTYSYRYMTPQLTIVPAAGGASRVVSDDAGDQIAWSPDSTQIAFSRDLDDEDDAPQEIYTVQAAGGAATRVTTGAVRESSWSPSWSPDGQWLTYLRDRLPQRFYAGGADIAVIRADGSGAGRITSPFPAGGTNDLPTWATGTVTPGKKRAVSPLVSVPAKSLTSDELVWEVAANGSSAAVLSSESELPFFWQPGATKLTPSRPSDVTEDAGDWYGLVMTSTHAAWFSAFAHSVVDPVTDVSLVVTSRTTRTSAVATSVSREGHNPPYETGPRLAADGALLVYNPDMNGSKLFRVDAAGAKPELKQLATGVAVADVNQNRIVGWRQDGTMVVLSDAGRVLATAPFRRATTTSVRLEGPRLFTTAGSRLSLSDLRGKVTRTWPLVDEGGRSPVLAGAEGDLAVYVSGVAVHILRLSTGRDRTLRLASQGRTVDVELTPSGLFYAYNAAFTTHPGKVGFVSLAQLIAATR